LIRRYFFNFGSVRHLSERTSVRGRVSGETNHRGTEITEILCALSVSVVR